MVAVVLVRLIWPRLKAIFVRILGQRCHVDPLKSANCPRRFFRFLSLACVCFHDNRRISQSHEPYSSAANAANATALEWSKCVHSLRRAAAIAFEGK